MFFQIKHLSFFNKEFLAKQWFDSRTAVSESTLALKKEFFCLHFQIFIEKFTV